MKRLINKITGKTKIKIKLNWIKVVQRIPLVMKTEL